MKSCIFKMKKRQKYINVIRNYVNVYNIQLEPKKGLKHKCV